MGIDYGDAIDTNGERWLILNDAKTDDPAYLIFDDAEERKKKDGEGSLPVLLFHDEHGKKFCCSGYPRQVEYLAKEWGSNTNNWVGLRVRLERKGRSLVLRPAELAPVEEPIGM